MDFVFGFLTIHPYGLFISVAVLAGFVLTNHRAKNFKISANDLLNLFLICTPLSVVGARLYHVFSEFNYYSKRPSLIFSFSQGGLGIFGAIVGGLIGVFIYSKYKNLNFGKVLDLLAPALILGQGIGRWGNIINGELLPYAIYESILDFAIFLFLTCYPLPVTHCLFPIYAILYGTGRFFLEFLRTEPATLGFLKLNQIVSLILVVSGVLILLKKKQ